LGRIVSNFFISLDGVVESPHEWHFPHVVFDTGVLNLGYVPEPAG
jgi:hypothetical protein